MSQLNTPCARPRGTVDIAYTIAYMQIRRSTAQNHFQPYALDAGCCSVRHTVRVFECFGRYLKFKRLGLHLLQSTTQPTTTCHRFPLVLHR